MSTDGGGWLTTKKRGRDDDEIERARRMALEARRRGGTTSSSLRTTSTAGRGSARSLAPASRNYPKPKKKSSSAHHLTSSRHRHPAVTDSLAGFLVDDEEELEVYSSSTAFDDEDDNEEDDDKPLPVVNSKPALSLSDSLGRRTPPTSLADPPQALTNHSHTNHDDDDDEEEDSDDEALTSFFQDYKRRTSKPPPAMQAAAQRRSLVGPPAGTRKPGSLVQATASKKPPSRKAPASRARSPPVDSDTDPEFANTPPPPAAKNQRTLALLNSANSDSEEDALVGQGLSATRRTRPINVDDDSSVSPLPGKHSKYFKSAAVPARQETISLLDELDHGLSDTPASKATMSKKIVGRKKKIKHRIITEDNSEDEAAGKKAPVAKPVSGLSHSPVDACSDDDEAVALAWALEESRKAATKQQEKPTERNNQGQEPVVLDDSSDNEEDQQDAYVDDDAQVANSVLATANRLSAHVLQAMAQWSSSSSDATGNNAQNGMIVDGALALFSTSTPASATKSNGNHDWISKEVLQRICPNVTLADYQLIGVNWMALLNSMKFECEGQSTTNVNGILADEMGLGKTVQTIAFLRWLKYSKRNAPFGRRPPKIEVLDQDSDDDGEVSDSALMDDSADTLPHLVVCPSSVLSNWEREFHNVAPDLNVVKYHGSQSAREELREELSCHRPGRASIRKHKGVAPIDVILAPITYFQTEKGDDRSFLRKFRYDYMIVDEAHLLKNARGTRYKSLDRFSTQHRLLLTGTPVQNSPGELMALLAFLMPLFSRKGADEDSNDGGEKMLQFFVSLESHNGASDQNFYKKLKLLFAPFVLRRRKTDVLNQIMPPKERKVEFVELDAAARCLYDSILEAHVRAKKKGKGTAAAREHLFTSLRKAAHHPLLLRSRHTSKSEKDDLAHWFHQYGAFRGEASTKARVYEELERYNDFEIHLTALELVEENELRRPNLERYLLNEDDLFASAKFIRLKELLPDLIRDGHRVLIFSLWTSCLDLIGCLMDHLQLKFLRMEGSTPVDERQNLIDLYNRDESISVFLLSTRACGLGINLTAADVCIMHDLDFNPFNDLQAEDRCHRIGQTKPVTVIKMVSKDTVDEDIYAMQQRKAQMNAAIMERDSNDMNKELAMEKDVVLKTALDRFLRSPQARRIHHDGKENMIEAVERDQL